MGNCLVATVRTMNVTRVVRPSVRNGIVFGRIRVRDRNSVLFYRTIGALMVQVSVVGIVDMSIVPDGQMSASRAVFVGMTTIVFACHGPSSKRDLTGKQF
jgi:hypothetical protein